MADQLTFEYRAQTTAGKKVKGTLDAASQQAAVAKLYGMSLVPLDVAEQSATGLNMEIKIGNGPKVKLKDLAIMARQMSAMIGAGLPLLRVLSVVEEQTPNKALKAAVGAVKSDVESGQSFSSGLAKHPHAFPPIMVSLVRVGETGGFLDRSLESIANNFDTEVRLRNKVKAATAYPIVVFCMAIAGMISMLTFVVPVFENMFASMGGELPLPTQILIVLSRSMVWLLPTLIVLGIVFSLWWSRHKNDENVRAVVDPAKLKLPVVGKLFRKIAVSRFARNMSTMLSAGVPILQALDIVGDTSGSWVIKDALEDVKGAIRAGRPMSEPLTRHDVFPEMLVQMVAVGEDAGEVETMFSSVADFYDEEVETATDQLTSLIEPLLIAFIGIVIGGMVIALYMPMFTLYGQLAKQ